MTRAEIVEKLSGVDIFKNSPFDVLNHIASVIKVEKVGSEHTIILKGDIGDCMYVMTDGKVKIHDGEHTIVELEGMQVFGEMALLNTEPRTASVTTLSTTTLLRLDQKDFYAIVAESPAVVEGIIRMLTHRLRNQNESIIQSLKEREKKLVALVEERTADLMREKKKLEEAYKEISSKNEELSQANHEIAEKTKNITASINYAKRIQDSLLPQIDQIKSRFPESYVLFKPRDIVSGDCYWFGESGDVSIFAAIDCTGHGVPGALMSMIGNTLMNQIVNMRGENQPDRILNGLHIGVRRALKQDVEDSRSKDGMDVALIAFNKKTKKLQFAGANRPMLMIHEDGSHLEVEADKMSIGGHQKETARRFTLKEFEINTPTCVFLSTDGYADQFGGPHNRKFMKKNMRELHLKIFREDFVQQQQIMDQTILDWMSGYPQIDDILVAGFKLS